MKTALAFVVFVAWTLPGVFVVLVPAELAALACLIVGRWDAADACMEWGDATLAGERGPIAPLYRRLDV